MHTMYCTVRYQQQQQQPHTLPENTIQSVFQECHSKKTREYVLYFTAETEHGITMLVILYVWPV